MNGLANQELGSSMWKLLYFLEELFGVVSQNNNLHVPQDRASWYAEENDDGNMEVAVYFEFRHVNNPGIQDYPVWIGIYLENEQFYRDHPIWIFVGRLNDQPLFAYLTEEFPNGLHDQDYWAIGLDLQFASQTPDADVARHAEETAEKIIRAFLQHYGVADGNGAGAGDG